MSTPHCDRLDAYLCGWLSEDEAAGYEAHLTDCPACRRHIEQQRGIDRLLAPGPIGPEAVPASVIDRVEGRIRLRRRRAAQWAVGLSAAAVLVLALGIQLMQRDTVSPSEAQPVADRQGEDTADEPPPAPAESGGKPSTRVTLADPSEAILVTMETKAPNVSIVWVYNTIKPPETPTVSAPQ
ncbi:MAG: anti-sigma factor family protein [Planctomycetota bacterium]|jgi:hypothetical protein